MLCTTNTIDCCWRNIQLQIFPAHFFVAKLGKRSASQIRACKNVAKAPCRTPISSWLDTPPDLVNSSVFISPWTGNNGRSVGSIIISAYLSPLSRGFFAGKKKSQHGRKKYVQKRVLGPESVQKGLCTHDFVPAKVPSRRLSTSTTVPRQTLSPSLSFFPFRNSSFGATFDISRLCHSNLLDLRLFLSPAFIRSMHSPMGWTNDSYNALKANRSLPGVKGTRCELSSFLGEILSLKLFGKKRVQKRSMDF